MQRQNKTSSVFIVFVTLLLTIGSVASPTPVRAAGSTITVTTNADNTTSDTLCSLREAINNANLDTAAYPDCAAGPGNDTIVFATDFSHDSAKIVLGSTLPTTTDVDGLIIDGGDGFVFISGNANFRVITVSSLFSLTLKNLIVQGGYSGTRGGAIVNSGTLTIVNCLLLQNTANSSSGAIHNTGRLTIANSIFAENFTFSGSGGAIYNEGGTLKITNSTFDYNSAGNTGGAIYNNGSLTIRGSTFKDNDSVNGAIFNNGTVTISNSTFTRNRATDIGGAIFNGKTLTITNSTFSENSAISHGGGDIYMMYPGATLNLYNNIFANSRGGGHCNKAEGTVSSRNNLIEDASFTCGLKNGVDGNITGSDPLLGALVGYYPSSSGPAPYFPLLSGSPAINKGSDANCPATDQRGVTRPQGSHCDIGSYEYKSP